MSNAASRRAQLTDLQERIADAVVLLLELKARPGLSRANRRAIDDAVESLQKVSIDLPEVAKSHETFQVVFDAILKAINVWRRLFNSGG